MKVSQMYPKRYATGDDLHGKSLTLTIAGVKNEKMRPQPNVPEIEKWVVYFIETKKGIVLNRTLAYQIAEILGNEETQEWQGKKITIYPQSIMVAGKKVNTIRARAAKDEQVSDNRLLQSLSDE
jgi:hypothetical protein